MYVQAINQRYGSMATLAFGLAVLFRLYQEVWSNAVVSQGRLHVCRSMLRPSTGASEALACSRLALLQALRRLLI